MHIVRDLVAVFAIAVLALSAGCGLKVQSHGPSGPGLHPQEDIAVTRNQARLRMRSLVPLFTGEIERAADQIAAGTSDPEVKRAAIRWKIEGVPALRAALFQPQPGTAVLDMWVFTFQMADYFDTGPGRAALGAAAPLAVETSRRMENDFAAVAATFTYSKDVSKVRAIAKQWAAEHPIRDAIRNRESALGLVLDHGVGLVGEWSIGETVAEAAVTADDLHRELQIYSDHLFRQARWEAELLLVDLGLAGVQPLAERALKSAELVVPLADRAVRSAEYAVLTLDGLTPAIKAAADSAAGVPALVVSERQAVMSGFHDDLTGTLTFVQNERIATLEQLTQERLAAFADIADLRVAVMRDIDEIAANQGQAISQEVEAAGIRVVDHAMRRITQLLVGAFVVYFLSALIFLLLIRSLFFTSRRQPRDRIRGVPPAA